MEMEHLTLQQGGTSKYFGLATRTPKGGVPNSRISVYKVCWASGCASADILAAFDDAIPDGVDIISTSLGSVFPLYYLEEPIAIGSFPTMKTRTVDRKFVVKAVLGNGEIYNDVMQGNSVNNFDLHGKSFPLIYEGDAANFFAGANSAISRYCTNGVMNSHKLKGRLFSAKPSRMVLASWNPVATILDAETEEDVMAPYVVSFSTKGPNAITLDVLKPDLTAPGVDILAAWSPVAPPSIDFHDTKSVDYNIISGTSMSCPRASVAAAFVKAAHPEWLAASIKSAVLTTARVLDPNKHNELEFAYGFGHINSLKAVKPGLVFDLYEADYVHFLCKQGYNSTTLKLITGDNGSGCGRTKPGRAWDLNNPSFSLAVEDGQPVTTSS
ncbi:hypothetical protein EV2_039079 [Malus domestica]